MEQLKKITEFTQLKTLAGEQRLSILRILMARPATLSQLGKELGQSPAHIRHHLLKLEGAGLIRLVEMRAVRGFVEKYYRATGSTFLLHELVLPASSKALTFVVSGSHDLALELLAEDLPDVEMIILPVGSIDGLVALRQGSAQIAGCHLLDADSGEYNLPYVKHFFPDREVNLITLGYRDQGFLVAPGNPLRINQIEDLARSDVRFTNRNRGSGTRLWLDRQLSTLNLPGDSITGYSEEDNTHTKVAERVACGEADTGIGLLAAAQQAKLDFVPLFNERYDLVIPKEQLTDQHMAPLFDKLQSSTFRREVNALGGYETTQTGDVIIP